MPGISKGYDEKPDKQKGRGQARTTIVEKMVSGETTSEQKSK